MNDYTQHEEILFEAARALPVKDRPAFLDRSCPPGSALKSNVESLLRCFDTLGGFMETALPEAKEVSNSLWQYAPGDEDWGQTIGRYKLIERIGEGGCGVVCLAEQLEPVRRQVALKIIKLGLDTRAVVTRFEAERQALALMDHPNIARVFDGGSTESGRPYFVMELVRGTRIMSYCDAEKLNTEARLHLFVQICHAIQHAHQKGIIHRDLKPSNILVTVNDGIPTPKVIDFGIAKAINEVRLTGETAVTHFNEFIGTPAYMSPEQAMMMAGDIDTRSDIYSLGVLLYELLTGQQPFDARTIERASVDEIRRVIREVDPLRPSACVTALSTNARVILAARRGIEPSSFAYTLRHDLDWIVLRCLEKERARRYPTASELAQDVRRFLDQEPVMARPPSSGYRFRKLIRRHRVGFAAAGAVLAALSIGLGLSLWQAIRATRAEQAQNNLRHRAEIGELAAVNQGKLTEAARAQAEGLVSYLLEDLYDDLEATGKIEGVTRLASEAVAYYDRLPAGLRNADTQRNRAVALMRQSSGLWRQGKIGEAEPMAQEAIAIFSGRQTANPESEAVTCDLAFALQALAREGLSGTHDNTGTDDRNGIAIRRAFELMQPWAKKPNASRRVRVLYATVLSTLCSWQSMEQAAETCAEGQRVLAELGVTDLSDLKVVSTYCALMVNEAYFSIQLGRLETAVRLNREANALVDQVLKKRPSDQVGLSNRCSIIQNEWLLAERQADINAMPEIAGRCERAWLEAVRFDPANALNFAGLIMARERLAGVDWEAGRISESLAKFYEAFEDDRGARQENASVLEQKYWILMGLIWREDQCGRGGQNHLLTDKLRLTAKKMKENGCMWPEVLAEFTDGAKYYGAGDSPEFSERAFEQKKLALSRIARFPRDGFDQTLLHALHWNVLLGIAHFGNRSHHYAEVETLLRDPLHGAETGNTPSVQDASYDMEPYLLYSIALIRQGKKDAAREAVARPFKLFNRSWMQGDHSISTVRAVALSRYVQALAESDDADGRLRRRASLDEAAAMLDQLSDEAKQLSNWRELIHWIAEARAQ